jgi:exodeoxyribonuclease-5
MIKDYLSGEIKLSLGFQATNEQQKLINELSDFILSDDFNSVFILRGYAGTGKTSVVSALVKTMTKLERQCVLMAPTGRAAKVLSLNASHPAYTIHRRIYRQQSKEYDASFSIGFNGLKQTLFVVDEASMISNDQQGTASYGTGRLLDDLIQFVYSGSACRLLLVGDTAQLPPVGAQESVALSDAVLAGYGLHVRSFTLRQVVRQASASGVLWNATQLRSSLDGGEMSLFPKVRFAGFNDIVNIPGNELIEELSQCYDRVGHDDTIIVCRSNKLANIYNKGVRYQILGRESELESGDMLMVAKNNYYWPAQDVDEKGKSQAPMDYIANGDICKLVRIGHYEDRYGLHFADARLLFPDYQDQEIVAKVLLDTLDAESASLTYEQANALYQGVSEDYAHLSTKKKRYDAVREDPFFNALQLKYANAITGHKSQGGQWRCVFIDNPFWQDFLTPDDLKWLYTALTRAVEKVYLVNFKNELFI